MTKILKHIFLLSTLLVSFSASAQTTTSSPYSTYGLGNLRGAILPQNRAIGGLSAGLRRPGGYFNINAANPASYSALQLTAFDVGAGGAFSNLSKSKASETSFNASLSHLAFAIPVSKKSALSFGLMPYTELGYSFSNTVLLDTLNANYAYRGEGGVSKAYLGYGFQLGNHVSLGFNVSYLFGKLSKTSSTEFPLEPSAISSRVENSNSVGGFSFDYGLQYFVNLSPKTKFTIGYSGSANSKINSTNKTVITRYKVDQAGNESIALDTLFHQSGIKSKITLPLMHTVGFTFEGINKWLLGADFSYGQWSGYREGKINPQLHDSYGFALGGQFTPDISAVSNYFKLVDYRLGFKYDNTYIHINNTDIKQVALTFGFGFPLPSTRTSFYKINLGAELGKRGTLQNNLVRERFANIYLGFTLNDKWFQKYKFD